MKKIDYEIMSDALILIVVCFVLILSIVFAPGILLIALLVLVWFAGVPYVWNKIVDWKEKKDE